METFSLKMWAESDRPRERLINHGVHTLSDADLIAILIRSGTTDETAVELGRRILHQSGNSLGKLARCSMDHLSRFKGMGPAKAATLLSALELGRRRRLSEAEQVTAITNSNDAAELFLARLCDLEHEEFWMVMLNRANHVIARQMLSRGGVAGTVVDPKLVFRPAVEKAASGLILFHNHPSGNRLPSDADRILTRKLVQAGRLLDIQVLDHIIIAGGAYFSFSDEGHMG